MMHVLQLTIQVKMDIFMVIIKCFLKLIVNLFNIQVNHCILIFILTVQPSCQNNLKLHLNT